MATRDIFNSNFEIKDQYLPNPYPYPAQAPNINEVLTAGNDCLNSTIQNCGAIGVDLVETEKISQGNYLDLQIGDIVAKTEQLKIQGATSKGSLLVGNGTETKELVVSGINGYVLTVNSGNPLGVEWAVGGGGGGTVNSVSGGTNINVTGTLANPIVNLNAPLTSQLNVGSQVITSSTSTIEITPLAGNDCNINCSGTGHLHVDSAGTAGPTQPLMVLENTNGNNNACHIDIYKNSASPAVDDAIGALSFHSNSSTGINREYARIQADLRDPTNTSENGSISLSACVNSSTPTEFLRINGLTNNNELYKFLETRGNYVMNTTAGQNLTFYQSVNGQSIVLLNSGASGNITNSCNGAFSSSSGTFSLTGSSSVSASSLISNNNINITAGNNVQITQTVGSQTKLITDLPNYKFYPNFVQENNNSSGVGISAPQVPNSRLSLINKGITPTTAWNDYGSAISPSYVIKYSSATGNYWVGYQGTLYVVDSAFTTIIATVSFSWNYGNAEVWSMCEASPYMFVGGLFSGVNGNATPQFGVTRINVFTYTEDPIYDSMSNFYGVNNQPYNVKVYALASEGSNIYVGGDFFQLAPSTVSVGYLFRIENAGASGGSQVYTDLGQNLSCNSPVYSLLQYNNYIFCGGAFTSTNTSSPTFYQYLSAWDYVGSSWQPVDGNNFNSTVRALSSSLAGYVLAGGDFTHSGHQYVCYVDGSSPSNPSQSLGTTITSSVPLYGVNSQNGLDLIIDNNSNVYSSNTFQTWTNRGLSNSGYAPSGVYFFGGEVKGSYSTYSYLRNNSNVPQSCIFTGPSGNTFQYNGTGYQNFTINAPYQAQEFISDSTNLYWIPLGPPLGTFS